MTTIKISALPESTATNDLAIPGVEGGITVKMSNSISSTQVVTALGFAPAPLASPTFTGTPAAPTPSTADSTTKLATTAFVKAQSYVTALTAPVTSVASKTGAVTLVVGDVSGAAPLSSPTFTGTPAAPTPIVGDNSTALATTAFVKAQGYQAGIQFQDEGTNLGAAGAETIVNFVGAGVTGTISTGTLTVTVPGGGSTALTLNSQTGTTYTLVLGDVSTTSSVLVDMNNAAANTVTLPPNSSVAAPLMVPFYVRQKGAGITSIAAGAGVTILPTPIAARVQGSMLGAMQITTNTWAIWGDFS